MYKRIYIVTVLLIIFCITYYVKNNYIKDKFQDLTTNAVETQYHLFLGYISTIPTDEQIRQPVNLGTIELPNDDTKRMIMILNEIKNIDGDHCDENCGYVIHRMDNNDVLAYLVSQDFIHSNIVYSNYDVNRHVAIYKKNKIDKSESFSIIQSSLEFNIRRGGNPLKPYCNDFLILPGSGSILESSISSRFNPNFENDLYKPIYKEIYDYDSVDFIRPNEEEDIHMYGMMKINGNLPKKVDDENSSNDNKILIPSTYPFNYTGSQREAPNIIEIRDRPYPSFNKGNNQCLYVKNSTDSQKDFWINTDKRDGRSRQGADKVQILLGRNMEITDRYEPIQDINLGYTIRFCFDEIPRSSSYEQIGFRLYTSNRDDTLINNYGGVLLLITPPVSEEDNKYDLKITLRTTTSNERGSNNTDIGYYRDVPMETWWIVGISLDNNGYYHYFMKDGNTNLTVNDYIGTNKIFGNRYRGFNYVNHISISFFRNAGVYLDEVIWFKNNEQLHVPNTTKYYNIDNCEEITSNYELVHQDGSKFSTTHHRYDENHARKDQYKYIHPDGINSMNDCINVCSNDNDCKGFSYALNNNQCFILPRLGEQLGSSTKNRRLVGYRKISPTTTAVPTTTTATPTTRTPTTRTPTTSLAVTTQAQSQAQPTSTLAVTTQAQSQAQQAPAAEPAAIQAPTTLSPLPNDWRNLKYSYLYTGKTQEEKMSSEDCKALCRDSDNCKGVAIIPDNKATITHESKEDKSCVLISHM